MRYAPHLAGEWYYAKNCGFGPEDFSYGSAINVWWKCSKNSKHIWRKRIHVRTIRRYGCPFCAGKKVSDENSLATLFPKIAKEWHSKNKKKPSDYTAYSGKYAWWQCARNPKHNWRAEIGNRTANGTGCPHCHDERLLDLKEFPKLMKLFDAKKNKGLNRHKLTTETLVWWRCPEGPDHSWLKPFRKTGDTLVCPFCRHSLPSVTNSLANLFPELAKELHPTRNKGLTAQDIPARKHIRLWWRCSNNPRHVWQATAGNRTVRKSGCPKCWKIRRPAYFAQLHALRKLD